MSGFERLTLATGDEDLRRYGLVMMAAARENELSERLLRMARVARQDESVAICGGGGDLPARGSGTRCWRVCGGRF